MKKQFGVSFSFPLSIAQLVAVSAWCACFWRIAGTCGGARRISRLKYSYFLFNRCTIPNNFESHRKIKMWTRGEMNNFVGRSPSSSVMLMMNVQPPSCSFLLQFSTAQSERSSLSQDDDDYWTSFVFLQLDMRCLRAVPSHHCCCSSTTSVRWLLLWKTGLRLGTSFNPTANNNSNSNDNNTTGFA